jgi:hypothetical protein
MICTLMICTSGKFRYDFRRLRCVQALLLLAFAVLAYLDTSAPDGTRSMEVKLAVKLFGSLSMVAFGLVTGPNRKNKWLRIRCPEIYQSRALERPPPFVPRHWRVVRHVEHLYRDASYGLDHED